MRKIYWKSPKQKTWWTFIVDGKRIGTYEDSPSVSMKVTRIKNLDRCDVREANLEDLAAVNAKTVLPSRIVDKMRHLASAGEHGIKE